MLLLLYYPIASHVLHDATKVLHNIQKCLEKKNFSDPRSDSRHTALASNIVSYLLKCITHVNMYPHCVLSCHPSLFFNRNGVIFPFPIPFPILFRLASMISWTPRLYLLNLNPLISPASFFSNIFFLCSHFLYVLDALLKAPFIICSEYSIHRIFHNFSIF